MSGDSQVNQATTHHDTLREIPSPSRRLWLGLCVILSTFGVFAYYTAQEIRWLEGYQLNVVQRNRKSSLQLLRLQNDSFLLALAIRDIELNQGRQAPSDWKPEISRLLNDMQDATRLEGEFAASTLAAKGLRERLQSDLTGLGRTADQLFQMQDVNKQARASTESDLEGRRAEVTAVVSQLLRMNDAAQVEAAERITGVYGSVKWDVLAVTGLLFLLALATGLYVFQASRRTFEKLRLLAEQLNDQSNQLRDLSWRLIDVQEQTLRRVARDLHDQFGQILTAVGLLLNRAGKKSTDPEMLQELETARSVVQETLQKVRDQSQMFRPAILDDFGLEQTLEWFVKQFSQQTGIPVHFDSRLKNGNFSSEDAIHLYRIVQEALNNVARHSKAGEAWVQLEEADGNLSIEVRDNGVGFDANPSAERGTMKGLGLLSMRERAEHLNGTLNVQSARGNGTVVVARVSIQAAAARAATKGE